MIFTMSDSFKIVMIGGGSVAWTPHLATDLFLTPELRGSRLVLVDINPQAATLLQRYCQMVADSLACGWRVEVADLESALPGAHVVTVAISTGGLAAMHNDVTIPERFGVFHSVGDTVGPGGISRVLRNVPVFVDLARQMERHCPHAWMVHVTNPLAQITRAVNAASSIRCLGLCHNYLGTRAFMANFFKCQREEVVADSVGVNHFSWFKNLTVRGKPVTDRLTLENYLAYEAAKKTAQRTGSTEDAHKHSQETEGLRFYLNFELCEQLGIFPVGGASHVAENYPHYLNSVESARRHRIHRKGVFPSRQQSFDQARQRVLDCVEGRTPLPAIEDSIEQLAPVCAALLTGKAVYTVVNVPNVGQITNLPRQAVVETWGHVTWDRVTPAVAGDVPAPVTGMVQAIVQEEELAVEAALTGDRDKVVQAMHASPLLVNKDAAVELADALLEANARWLPQFHRPARRPAPAVTP
jgi:alpha-galactosidase